jgi:hypothetical protein
MLLKRKRDARLGEGAGRECLGGGAMAARLVDGYFSEVLAVMRKMARCTNMTNSAPLQVIPIFLTKLLLKMFDIFDGL